MDAAHHTSGFQYDFNFPYRHGIKHGEVSMFDVRDVALAQHCEFRHGDRLERDGRYFTVVGIKLNEEGRPRVYTQADEDAGAAFHEGGFSSFRKVGSLKVAAVDARSTSTSQHDSSEQMDRKLAKLIQQGKLDRSGRKKVAEVRQLLKQAGQGKDNGSEGMARSVLDLKPDFPVKLRSSNRVPNSVRMPADGALGIRIYAYSTARTWPCRLRWCCAMCGHTFAVTSATLMGIGCFAIPKVEPCGSWWLACAPGTESLPCICGVMVIQVQVFWILCLLT